MLSFLRSWTNPADAPMPSSKMDLFSTAAPRLLRRLFCLMRFLNWPGVAAWLAVEHCPCGVFSCGAPRRAAGLRRPSGNEALEGLPGSPCRAPWLAGCRDEIARISA